MDFSEIQERFINFYTAEGYRFLPRASMVDASIPMSFVMSAGLVQVEHSLAKAQVRDSNKFVLVQDCFRHFDLDKVGTDDFHLSLFEMPGAFSFGANGKRETVQRMWKLAVSVFGVDKKKLWASYFKGGNILGNEIPEDHIVRQAWLDAGLPNEQIVGLGKDDNYWVQGKGFNGGDVTRKSGPNTELFFDRGIERSCGSSCQPGCKCGRFIEFSNSLFIRYEIDSENNQFKKLDAPFSETVIGSERVAMISQKTNSVFEIDIYAPLIQIIREYTQTDIQDDILIRIGERIIADHLRALVYLIADDAPPPGKNGRQRLIKKLIRGLIAGMELLEIPKTDFLDLMVTHIIESMSTSRKEEIHKIFFIYYAMQEKTFLTSIEKGKNELNRYSKKKTVLSGEQIVFLEKNMGMPYMLIKKELLSTGSMPFSEKEYKRALINWKKAII